MSWRTVRMASGGVAITTRLAPDTAAGRFHSALPLAPARLARSAVWFFRPKPTIFTFTFARLRAIPSDPPISPSPMIVSLGIVLLFTSCRAFRPQPSIAFGVGPTQCLAQVVLRSAGMLLYEPQYQ